MAWIYLAELEGSQRAWKATSDQSPTVKTTDTPKLFCFPECPTEHCPLHQFGMTLQAFEETCCRKSTLYMEDSHARIFRSQDAERAWEESVPDYFSRSQGLSARYDPVSCSWRTFQRLLFEEQSELLESFAAYGMTVDGEFFPLQMWERIIGGNDGGSWPTPRAGNPGSRPNKKGGNILAEEVKKSMWPTPNTEGWRSDGELALLAKRVTNPTEWQALTKRACKSKKDRYYPTPTSVMWKGSGPVRSKSWKHDMKNGNLKAVVMEEGNIGQLNPTWVEWLMGYRSEWTVLDPWVIPWFRPKHVKRMKD